jgi:hypothetical protein
VRTLNLFSVVWCRHFKLKYLFWVKWNGPVESNINIGLPINCKIKAVWACKCMRHRVLSQLDNNRKVDNMYSTSNVPYRLRACAASLRLSHSRTRVSVSRALSTIVLIFFFCYLSMNASVDQQSVALSITNLLFENLCLSPPRVAQANPTCAQKPPWLAHLRSRFRENVDHESRFSSCS